MRIAFLAFAATTMTYALSTGPPVMRAGVPGEANGLTCTACHRGIDLNADPAGFVRVQAVPYRPGVRQTVRVTVFHPEAARWGFQLTARLVSDLTKKAGSFTANTEVQVRCSDNSTTSGCGELTEFAQHVQPSTQGGASGARSWTVEWMPPATDVGEVIFYVAGNAANASGNNQGDRIYTSNRIVPNADGCSSLSAKPTITGVVNGASFQPAVSANGLISVFGSGLYPAGQRRPLQAGDIFEDKFPTRLNCVAVEVGGELVPITFAQDNQINAQLPITAGAGQIPVRIVVNPGAGTREQKSDPMMISGNPAAPAFFTFNGTAVAAASATDGALIGPAAVNGRPARPGDIVALFLTGLGRTRPDYQAGEIATGPVPMLVNPSIRLGDANLAAADVLYVGLAPGAITGLYQANIRIPANTAAGDLPIRITAGDASSPAGTILTVAR